MDRERTGYSDSSDSDCTKTTAGGTWWTGRGQVTVTVVTVTVQRRLLEGPGGQGENMLHLRPDLPSACRAIDVVGRMRGRRERRERRGECGMPSSLCTLLS